MSSLSTLATVTASTKRSPALSAGKRGAMAANLATVACTPLTPVDPELRDRLQLQTAHELLQTFAPGSPDILAGDLLVVGPVEYPVRAVAEWPGTLRGQDAFLHLVLEDLK